MAEKIEITEQGLGIMLKKNSMNVETLGKISQALNVSTSYWFSNETEVSSTQSSLGTGTIVGSGNLQKVNISRKPSSRQEVYGMGIDEIYLNLIKCESEREILKTKLAGIENLLAAKEETIAVLRAK